MTSFRLRDTTEERTFEVKGAPEMASPWNSVRIAPDIVVAKYINGTFTGAQVHGMNIKKDGTLGASRHDVYISASLDELPDWLKPVTDYSFGA